MTFDLLTSVGDNADIAVEYLARRGSRRTTWFFFGGAGMFFLLPVLVIGLFGAHLMRNPDKARAYKEKLRDGIASVSSARGRAGSGGQLGGATGGAPVGPSEGAPLGPPPRLPLRPRAEGPSPTQLPPRQ